MQRLVAILTLISWGLWLGGLVALLVFVTRLFAANRPIALQAAPVLFASFAKMQLIVGGAACLCGTVLAVRSGRKLFAIMTMLMLVALALAVLIAGWTDQMESLRHTGQSASDGFRALHAKTSIGYTSIAALLLASGTGIILGISTRRRATATSEAASFPGEAEDRLPGAATTADHAPLR